MIIKFPKSFIRWKNHVHYALHFRVSVANLYKSGAKLGIWFIFWVCKNIYKHKILLTHSILSPYGLLPRPPIMIYLKMIQEKAPIHELVIFVSRQWWDKRNFPPQIKVNNGVPTTFISCTYLDDAAGIKLGNIKERSCKSPTNLASKIHYKRQNGSAGILTSKNKAIINEYNRVWLIFRRKCFADVI